MKKHLLLYAIVAISGGSVLAVEILGTRILGPFYGVSLFLWSALISITLAALSLGYVLGGRWADRGASFARLSLILIGAGLWLVLVPWLRYPVLLLLEPLGLRFAVLAAATLLFFVPLTLLGMVSPYAIKLRTASLQEVGRSAGNIYAISTIASVIAAVLTGFVFIPNIGVRMLMLSIAGVLLLTGALGWLADRRAQQARLAVTLLLIGAALLALAARTNIVPRAEASTLVAVANSAYAELRVIDWQERRFLLIDGGVHTIFDKNSLESLHPYAAVMDLPQYLLSQPGHALLLGLGGGSVVKNYARNGWQLDAVEIDPVVTRFAFEHFDLDSSDARIVHQDARLFLKSGDRRYDVVLMDVFGSSSIPFHLVTREAFALCKTRLAADGILAINIESVGWEDLIVRSVVATLQQEFSHVLVLPIAEPPDRLGNIIVLAADREFVLQREIERDLTNPDYVYSPSYHKNHAWDNAFTPETRGAPVLTDDLNPVDIWSEQINLVARRELHEFFRDQAVSW